jgi:hypothetical protein
MLIGRIVQLLKENKYTSKDLVMLVGDLNINSKEAPFRLTMNSYLASYKLEIPIGKDSNRLRQPLNEESSSKSNGNESFSEYEIFQKILAQNQIDVIDHVMEKYGEHKVTYGDNETILTG